MLETPNNEVKLKTLFSILISTLFISVNSYSQAEIRMIAHDLHQGQLLVDLEIKATDAPFMLSSHNLRIYYNTQVASLSAFYSALPEEMYDDIVMSELIQNTDASIVNDLDYDEDLGFLNLSTEHNAADGSGVEVSEEWLKLGTIVFQGNGDIKSMQATWARERATGAYATAYVEITEWKENNTSEKIVINEFKDLTWQRSDFEKPSPEFSIGPNPCADFVIVTHQWTAPSAYELCNIQGIVLQSGSLNPTQQKIDLSQYTAGTYIVRLRAEDIVQNFLVEKVDYN